MLIDLSRYARVLYRSASEELFIVELPDLSGCVVDGKTHAEALANIGVVARQWIETAQELSREIPEPRGRPNCA